MERRSASEWYAESLRFTAFCSGTGENPPLAEWWAAVIGDQPDEVTNRPKERQASVIGRFGDGLLSLEYLPLRIDLKLQPSPKDVSEGAFWLNVGGYQAASEQFIRSATELIGQPGFPSVNRIAYGAILRLPVESREKGYRQLQPYLPAVTIDPENSSEFLYRINRRRESKAGIANLAINRLNQWNVTALRLLVGSPVPANALPEHYSCRLELDVNTIQDFPGDLPTEKLKDILAELVDAAKEIVSNGDT